MKKEKKEKKSKAKVEKAPKKPKYVEKVGITGEGVDYAVYHMNAKETMIAVAVGFVLGFAMVYIFFMNIIFSAIVGVFLAYKAIPLYQDMLQGKRMDRLRIQFRDFLEALASSYSAGQTALGGFSDARSDMAASHGEDSEFAIELSIILKGIENNYRLDDLLEDFAVRSHMPSIQNFVDTFNVCYRRGGEVRKVVNETKQMINDQMEIEMEIQTSITESKSSINIIAVMPFIIVILLRVTGNDSLTSNSFINVLTKLASLVIFVGSYLWGRKIMDIKF